MLGELVQTTDGKWIIHPTRCPNGHPLGPGELLVGHQAAWIGRSSTATTEAASPQWSGTSGGYRSQPFPKSMGPNGYGRDGYCGPETTGGALTIPTWPGRWHTVELPVLVH